MDADALLADLKSSVTPMSTHETKWESHTTTEHLSVSPSTSRVTTFDRSQRPRSPDPPPLPPLPSKEVLDSLQNSQEFYRDRSPGQPVYSSTITISKSVYNANGDEEHVRHSRSVSPGHARLDPAAGSLSTDARYGYEMARQTGVQQLSPHAKPSVLSNNLSELDSLLEDLSSAKFSAEVDKTSQNVLGNHSTSPQPSGARISPSGQRSGSQQRELEIPKLIVPSVQQAFSYYDDVDSCRNAAPQGPVALGSVGPLQQGLVSGPAQNQYYDVQQTVVATNVQQPPIQQLHPNQPGDQFRGSSPSPTFQMQKQQEQYIQQQQQMQQKQLQLQQQQLQQQQLQQQQLQQQQLQQQQLQQQQLLQQQLQQQQLQQQQLQQQQLQQQQFPSSSAVQVSQQSSPGQPMVQGQGLYEPLGGQGQFSQTTIQRYTEHRSVNETPFSQQNQPLQPEIIIQPAQQQQFVNQTMQRQLVNQPVQQQQFTNQTISQQQIGSQPLQQQFIRQTVTQQGTSGAQDRTVSASKDLEELMMSLSGFDVKTDAVRAGEPHYAQPIKARQSSSSSSGQMTVSFSDSSDGRGYGGNSQDHAATAGYLSASQGGQGLYESVSSGGLSPSPQEMVIQPSPSAVGHPVPSTVFTQNQSSSKMVVTQGMHGVLPQNGTGQVAGEGQLEMMLGKLGSDLSQQGILTIPKGDCAACNKPIVGQVLMAIGKIWHPEHFVCVHCRQELGTNIFFERDGHPYCESDYQILFSPKCALCSGTILEKCITALNKTWHPEHFFCAQCQRPFGEEGFHEHNGLPFCRDDYFRMFAPKCGGCGNPILSNYVTALQRQWHPECFVCRECHASFDSGSFFDHNGLPYCEQHFHAQRGSLCAACQQPIMGRCIAAMYRKFHPEHFVCVFCLQQLNKGTFKEQNDKPYCHPCFDKLFG